MYGTIARMRLKPGSEALLKAQLEAMRVSASKGFRSTAVYRSSADPLEIWFAVVFDSEEEYRANAESPSQHAIFTRLRSILEADPEWHDGEIIGIQQAVAD